MPRARSMAIQSEVTPRRPALPCTAPAYSMAAACSASASVNSPPDTAFRAVLSEVFHQATAHIVEFSNPIQGGTSANTVYVATTSPDPSDGIPRARERTRYLAQARTAIRRMHGDVITAGTQLTTTACRE